MKIYDIRRLRRGYRVKDLDAKQDILINYTKTTREQERMETERTLQEQRPKMPRVLAIDLDGTLVNDEKQVTPPTLSALMDLQRQGVRLVLASGRPTYGVLPVAKQLRMDRFGGFILSYNGGQVVDCQTMEVLYQRTLPRAEQQRVVEIAERDGHTVMGFLGAEIVTTRPDDIYVAEGKRINKMSIRGVDDLLRELKDTDVVKLLVVGEPERLARTEQKMQALREEGIWAYRSQPFFLETVPQGIDKAESLRKLLEHLNLKAEDMVAVGDGGNDLSMIQFAGVGVAMRNATEEVRGRADWVTTQDNNHDGLLEAVKKFFG